MKTLRILTLAAAALIACSASYPQQKEAGNIDKLKPVTLKQAELSGEIGRRINDLIYKNYMVLDLGKDYITPFRVRPFTDNYHYVGVGKVIDAGSLFSVYTGDERYLNFAAEIRHGNSTAEVQCASLLDWKQTFESGAAHVYVMLARQFPPYHGGAAAKGLLYLAWQGHCG